MIHTLALLMAFLGPAPQYMPTRPHNATSVVSCTGMTGTFIKCFTTVENPLSAPMVNASGGFEVCQSDGTGAYSAGSPGACMAMWQGVTSGSNQSSRVVFNQSTSMGASGPSMMVPGSTGYIYLMGPGAGFILEVSSGSGGYVPVSGCPQTANAGEIVELVSAFSGTNVTLTCNLYSSSGTLIGTNSGVDGVGHTLGYPSFVNDTGANGANRATKFSAN